MNVGYSDFVKLCRVDDSDCWCDWLAVRGDGVYVKEPPDGLTAGERAALSVHPTGNLLELALRFPCTLKELQTFLEWAGCYGSIDAFDMAAWVKAKAKDSQQEAGDRATDGNVSIAGNTFAKLQATRGAFDQANPPRSKKAFMRTLENLGCDTREQEVFANIVAEHFAHNWRS